MIKGLLHHSTGRCYCCTNFEVTSFNKLNDDLPSIDTVPKEVELDIDVLALVMENQILCEGNGRLVAHHQCWWVSFHTG